MYAVWDVTLILNDHTVTDVQVSSSKQPHTIITTWYGSRFCPQKMDYTIGFFKGPSIRHRCYRTTTYPMKSTWINDSSVIRFMPFLQQVHSPYREIKGLTQCYRVGNLTYRKCLQHDALIHMQGDNTSLKQARLRRKTAQHEDPTRPQYSEIFPNHKSI
jgi:hypothetical protein